MTKSFNRKALGAFKKLGVVALITATLATCLTACNQTGGGGGKPKHAITFSVDSTTPNGKLKAKADGIDETETSPINVEEGKTVTFTATANDGYRVKGWTLDGKPITEAGTKAEYKLKVTQAATVKVSFEAIPEHAISFSVEGANGTLKAMINEEEITSGTEIEEGKTVTFTAKADTGYRVKEWKVDDKLVADAGKSNTYVHIVTKVATITVSFEEIPKHEVTFSVEGENGTLTAKADGVDETKTSPITVEEGKTVTFTAKANAGYGVKEWKVDDTALQDNKENTYTHTVTQASTIKVSFELLPAGTAILTLDPNKLSIKVKAKTADGSSINVKGCTKTILANDTETTLTATDTKVILKGKITELNCSSNQILELNVQGLPALQNLWCSNNQLTELNVQGLTALSSLDCSFNKLTELNVQGLTALWNLNCPYNKLTKLDAHGLTKLYWLSCRDNQLTELKVQGCTALKNLDCSRNKLDAEAMTELLKGLPTRATDSRGEAILYTEEKDASEGNCKDFSTSESLKEASKGAKKRKWRLKYKDSKGDEKYISI